MDLVKIIGRIRALRSKTITAGCTEPEVDMAQEKAIELLFAYNLSWNDIDSDGRAAVARAILTPAPDRREPPANPAQPRK